MMTKYIPILLLLGLCHSIFSQVEDPKYDLMLNDLLSHSVKEITVAEATEKENIVFLDARESKEHKVSHIKNAIWIGYEDFSLSRLNNMKKDQHIIVYCSVGYRSEKITEKLVKAGYSDVQNLYGGIFEWVNQGHQVYRNAEPTESVHAYDKVWGIWLNKGEKVFD